MSWIIGMFLNDGLLKTNTTECIEMMSCSPCLLMDLDPTCSKDGPEEHMALFTAIPADVPGATVKMGEKLCLGWTRSNMLVDKFGPSLDLCGTKILLVLQIIPRNPQDYVECHYHVRSSLLNLASKHARFGGFKHVVCVWSQIFTHFGNRGNQRLLRVGLSGSEISRNFGQHKWKAQGKRRLDSTSLEIDFCQDASTWASTWQGVMLWEALDRYDLHQVIFWCQAPSKITLVPPFRSRRPAKEKAGYWWKIRKKRYHSETTSNKYKFQTAVPVFMNACYKFDVYIQYFLD